MNHISKILHNSFLIFCMATLLVAVSCRTSKKIVESESSGNGNINAICATYTPWTTFTAKGKIGASLIGGKSSTMELSMRYGKYITISLRPLLGIEVGRMYLTQDSLFIIDKYHELFVADKLELFTGSDVLDITMLQNLLIGRASDARRGVLTPQLAAKNFTINDSDGLMLTSRTTVAGCLYSYLFGADNLLRLFNVTMNDKTVFETEFSNYFISGTTYIPAEIVLTANVGSRKIWIDFSYNQRNIVWDKDMPETIGILNVRYPRLTMPQFISRLSN